MVLIHNRLPVQARSFRVPKPQGWPIERIVSLVAGAVVFVTQLVGGRSNRMRVLTGWVGVNLLLNAVAGWCPLTAVLHRLGVPTAAERARAAVEH